VSSVTRASKSNIEFVRHPALKHIEARFSRYRQPAFKKHFHETYAIGVVEQGISSFWHQNKTEIIGKGTIALINPGEVHACNPKDESEWIYKMFYVDIDLIQELAYDISEKNEGLPAFTNNILKHPRLYQELHQLYKLILESPDTLEKDSRAHETFGRLVVQHSNWHIPPTLPKKAFVATQRAYEYLMDNLTENISLHELASVTGLSAYHLLRVFQERFGLPPHTFQLQQRINIAKRMLAEGFTIAQVAFELGFTDQSHFTKKFKTFVGATPRQYQLASR
jgi:AraC-like DNA-binding protein